MADITSKPYFKYLPNRLKSALLQVYSQTSSMGGSLITYGAGSESGTPIEKTQANIDAYRQFFNATNMQQPKVSKWDSFIQNVLGNKFSRGLGTALMTPLRLQYGWYQNYIQPITKGEGTVLQTFKDVMSGKITKEDMQARQLQASKNALWGLLPGGIMFNPSSIKAALSSSWFAPDNGAYVNKTLTDVVKQAGASQRQLQEISPAWKSFWTKFEGENVTGKTGVSPLRFIGEHMKMITPAGIGGLAADIAADPFTYGGGYGVGTAVKAINKKVSSSILKGMTKTAIDATIETIEQTGKRGARLTTPLIKSVIEDGVKTGAELGGLMDDASKINQIIKRSYKADIINKLNETLEPVVERINKLKIRESALDDAMQQLLGRGTAYKAYKGAAIGVRESASLQARRGLLGMMTYRTPETLSLMSKRTQNMSSLAKGWGKLFVPSIEKNVPQDILNIIKRGEAWSKNEQTKILINVRKTYQPIVEKLSKLKNVTKEQIDKDIVNHLMARDDLARNVESVNAIKRAIETETKLPQLDKLAERLEKLQTKIDNLKARIASADPLIQQFGDVANIEMFKLDNALQKANILEEKMSLPGLYSRKYASIPKESFAGVKRNIGKANISELEKRAYKTWEQALAAGEKPLPFSESFTKTIVDETTRLGMSKTLNEISEQFGVAAKDAPSWFVEAKNVAGEAITELKGMKFEPEIAQALSNGVKLSTDKNVAKLIKYAWDFPLSIFKYSATAANIGFHIRNAISNYWLLFLKDGMDAFNPRTNSAAAYMSFYETFLKPYGKEVPILNTKIVGNLSMSNVLDLMYERGTLGAFMKKDIGVLEEGLQQVNKAKVIGKKIINTPLQIGSFVEDQARITGFINSLKKYVPEYGVKTAADMAAEQTFKFLFDYGDLTDFEKTFVKRIIPFYTWSRKNIPLQVEQLMKQPGKFALVEKIRRFEESLDSSIQDEKQYLPDYMKELDVWGTPLKTESGSRLWWNPNIAFNDLSRMMTIGGDITSMISPQLRVPLELGGNYNFYYKKPITSGSGYTEAAIPSFMRPILKNIPTATLEKFGLHRSVSGQYFTSQRMDYMMKNLPVLYNLAKSFPINEPIAGTPAAETLPYKRLSWLEGIKFIPSNVEENKLTFTKEEEALYQQRIQQLKKLGYLPEDFGLDDIKKLMNK